MHSQNEISLSMRKIFTLLFFLCACMATQVAWCMGTFSISRENNYFVISRTDASFAQTVKYRTISQSALAGKHFTAKTGNVTFAAGKDTVHVAVNETAIGNVDITYRYQNATSRSYLFEVTDVNGYRLALSDERAISYGSAYQFQNEYTSRSISNLLYFNSSGTMKSDVSSNKYVDAEHSGSKNTYVQITDKGYNGQTPTSVFTMSTSALFNAVKVPQSHLNTMGYKLYATVYFDQKEEKDGYQYIQILTDNSTTYDGNDPNGGVNTPSTSIYKACFILSYSPSGSVESNYHKQFFPHREDNKDYADYTSSSYNEFSYSNQHLYAQKFKSDSYKAANTGALVLSPTVNNINVRFDAAGDDADTWGFQNLKVRLALCDPTRPVVKPEDVTVSAGPYKSGQTVYVSIPFSEIVQVTGTPELSTSDWGTFTYVSGNNTNVLTFSGTVPSGSASLMLSSINGTIKDMAGNSISSGILNMGMGVTPLSKDTLNASNTFISGLADSYRETGSNIRPTPTVTYYSGTEAHTLTLNTDYTVTYYNNKSIGTAIITINGTGNYTGSLSKSFTIRGVELSDFTQEDGKYLISSKSDIEKLRLLVENHASAYTSSTIFLQTQDLNYNGVSFNRIGHNNATFHGTYDGGGHTISGLKVATESDVEYTGFFGYLGTNGVVRNLRIANSTFSGWGKVGTIAGESVGSIINCRVESDVTVKPGNNQSGYYHFGGVVGRMASNARVEGCYSAAVVTRNGKDNCTSFGGIVGKTEGNPITVINNVYAGSTVNAQQYKGSIIGLNSGTTTISNNVYLNNSPRGVDNTDVDGAKRAYKVRFEDGLSLSGAPTASYALSGHSIVSYGIQTDSVVYSLGGSTLTLNEVESRLGYDFGGFGYNNGSDHAIEGNSFTMPTSDISVYTIWTPIEYTISYDLGDGELPAGKSNPTTYTIESDTIVLVNPEREGYVFTGWTGTDLDGPTMTVTIPVGSMGNRSYSAHLVEAAEDSTGTKYPVIGATYTIDGFEAPDNMNGSGNETYLRLLDKNKSTKWCVVQYDYQPYAVCYVDFHLPEAGIITGYELTTGTDVENNPNRNPAVWHLYAKANEDGAWEEIDARDVFAHSEDALPATNTASITYPVEVIGNYQYFRFVIDSITGIQKNNYYRPIMELAELRLLTYAPDVIYARAAQEADCAHHIGHVDYWYRNGNYYSDETCTTPIAEVDDIWTAFAPTVTHYAPRPATLKQDSCAVEYWETECGFYSDETCALPRSVKFVEGGHGDDENGYWVRLLETDDRTIVLDNTVESFHVYDDGGAEGDYMANSYSYLTLVVPENYNLQITGTVITPAASADYLWIIDDYSSPNSHTLGEFRSETDGTPFAFGPLTTTGRDVQISFNAYSGSQYPGFDLTVTLVPQSNTPTDIEDTNVNVQTVKFIKDAQIFIERNGKTYTITGQEMVR